MTPRPPQTHAPDDLLLVSDGSRNSPGTAEMTRSDSAAGRQAATPRSSAPVDQLSRRLDAVCTHAVSPLEIAAALEADGITDAISRDQYAQDDVFALASELYARVPLRTSRYAAGRQSAKTSSRDIARGLLFALPGLFYFVVEPLFRSTAAPMALLVAVVAGWGISQVMAIVGHTLIGRGNGSGAGKVLGLVLIAGLALMALCGAIAALGTGWDRNLVAACCTQTLYVMAVAVLLLFERDRLLWLSLLPGAVVSVGYLAGNPLGMGREFAVAAVLFAMAFAFGSALYAADDAFQHDARSPAWLGRADIWTAARFGTYGLLVGLFLAAPVMNAALSTQSDSALLGAAMVPLVLSMGVAEWQLTLYNQRTIRAMDTARDMDSFGRVAWRTLLVAAGTHAAALLGLSIAAAITILVVVGHLPADVVGLLVAYLMLGAALFLALVLTTWGRIAVVLPILAIAVAAIWLPTLATPDYTLKTTEYLATSIVLAGCLWAIGWREVRVVANHGG